MGDRKGAKIIKMRKVVIEQFKILSKIIHFMSMVSFWPSKSHDDRAFLILFVTIGEKKMERVLSVFIC